MRVRIYQPTKTAMQSGRAKTKSWTIDPELPTPRAPEPLMGWVSAEDTLSMLRNRLYFATADEAMAFAKKNGWDAVVDMPAARKFKPRNYMDNFRVLRPQDEERAN